VRRDPDPPRHTRIARFCPATFAGSCPAGKKHPLAPQKGSRTQEIRCKMDRFPNSASAFWHCIRRGREGNCSGAPLCNEVRST